jgi:hypothetical protein
VKWLLIMHGERGFVRLDSGVMVMMIMGNPPGPLSFGKAGAALGRYITAPFLFFFAVVAELGLAKQVLEFESVCGLAVIRDGGPLGNITGPTS